MLKQVPTDSARRRETPPSREAAAVLRLARAYVEAATSQVARLRDHAAEHDLLHAWRSGRLPRRGHLPGPPRLAWQFHGVGCRFRFPGGEVDVDFGPGGEADRFDEWRLLRFAQGRGWDVDEADVAAGLERLLDAGLVRRTDDRLGPPYALAAAG